MSQPNWPGLLVALLLSLACLFSFPETGSAADERIGFGVNGSVWKRALGDKDREAEKFYKLILLRGVLDGMMFGESPYMAPGSGAIYTATSYDHLIDALDQFYADYRNEKIFVVWALLVVSMELRGDPRSKIEAALIDYRRRVADLERRR